MTDSPQFTNVKEPRPRLMMIEALLVFFLAAVAIVVTNYLTRLAREHDEAIVKIPGLIEAVSLEITSIYPGLKLNAQNTSLFSGDIWAVRKHAFFANLTRDGFVEYRLNVPEPGKKHLRVYFTRANDYGIIQVKLNNKEIGPRIDLCLDHVAPLAPVDLGVFEFTTAPQLLRITAVDRNPKNERPHYQFGWQGYTLKAE